MNEHLTKAYTRAFATLMETTVTQIAALSWTAGALDPLATKES